MNLSNVVLDETLRLIEAGLSLALDNSFLIRLPQFISYLLRGLIQVSFLDPIDVHFVVRCSI